MFSSQIIDVAIGLALMYMFQSILVSGLNEFIVSAFSYRGKVLQRFLNLALRDKDQNNNLFKKIYGSPYLLNLTKIGRIPSEITSRNFADATVEMINRGDFSSASISEKIKHNIQQLPESNFKDILASKIEETHGDVEAFKKSIEDWYNDYMAKVSRWYKSRMNYFILAFSFFITVAMNVDSFRVMNELWKNEKLRESVVNLSEEITRQEYKEYLSDTTAKDSLDVALNKVNANYQKLHLLDFPITWAYEYQVKNMGKGHMKELPLIEKLKWSFAQINLEKFLGFLITTMAVSIGAPIWFDLIKKLVSARDQLKKLNKTD